MKTKIRPEHAGMLQMNDWLAELRDGESAEPAGPGKAEPIGPGPGGPGYAVPASYGYGVPAGHAEPGGYVRAGPAAGSARPEALAGPAAPAAPAATAAPARTATRAVPAGPAARTTPAGPAGAAVRAVIGDQLRMPVMWCEMGSCVCWYADPAALGEADTRARAIGAGWRIDALGRLACPRCQQSDPGFRASRPVAVRDRDMALASTVPIPAVPGDGTACAARGYPPASRAEPERHPDLPADEARARWQVSGKPGRNLHPLGAVLNPARAWRARGGRQAAPRRDSEHGEDLTIGERAHACSAAAMTSTGR